MSKSSKVTPNKGLGLYLGLVAASLLVYQVLTTRILSALLVYHYAFLVASFSVMGMALGAWVAARSSRLAGWYRQQPRALLAVLGLVLAGMIATSFAAFAALRFEGPTLYVVIGALPYGVGGAALALILSHHREASGRLYAGDLLGAACGTLGAVGLLDAVGMEKSWPAPVVFALLAAVAASVGKWRRLSLLSSAVMAVAVILFRVVDTAPFFGPTWSAFLDSPHTLYGQLSRERGKGALTVVHTTWDSFSRTDVIEPRGEPDRKAVTIDGVAYSGMFRFDGDVSKILRYPDTAGYFPSIGHVPFAGGHNDKVLVLGSGAGRDVLYAIANGAREIDAVEINPGSIEAVRRFGDFNGHLYDRPDVHVFATDGRAYVEQTAKRYDLILITLIKTEAVGAAGLSAAEDYMLTAEAFVLYLEHLEKTGRLALFVHHDAALAKATATALSALTAIGIPETAAPDHLAVFNSHQLEPNEPVHQPLLVVSRSPMTQAQARALAIAAESRDNLTGYLPHFREADTLAEVKSGERRAADFAEGLPYYADPATDDRPFFYRFDDTFVTLLAPAAGLAVLLLVAFSVPLLRQKPRPVAHMVYFALTGVGFMGVETLLVQQLTGYLGAPARSFAVVLTALLAGGAMGSRWSDLGRAPLLFQNAPSTALVVGPYLLLLQFALPRLASFGIAEPLAKAMLALSLVVPIGILLGPLLPIGLKRAASLSRGTSALLIALNGAAGVGGAIAAVLLSMYAGFFWTSVVLAVTYAAAFLMGAGGRLLGGVFGMGDGACRREL